MTREKRITLFQWGYEGWGSSTKELVAIADATERHAGFEPPIFADIRYSRSVRAPGFRDKAFADQLVTGATAGCARSETPQSEHAEGCASNARTRPINCSISRSMPARRIGA